MLYFDHHAAAPLLLEAREAMDAARDGWANPSSAHAAGRRARALVEGARRQVASAVGAAPADVVFTSGGTEACAALFGVPAARVLVGALAHPAMQENAARTAERHRAELVRVAGPERWLETALRPDDLVAATWVNHEVGTITPLAELAERCHDAGAHLVVDATQALGKVPVDIASFPTVAGWAFASHKIGGPSGVGAWVVSRGVDFEPALHGGGQERGRRGGSQPAWATAAFGAACGTLPAQLAAMPAVARRRDRLEAAAAKHGAVVNGRGPRVATVTNVSVPGWRGEELVAALDLEGLCASAGAACSSGVSGPSPVVAALHPEEPWRAEATLRLSLGPGTTGADVDAAIAILDRVLPRART